MRRLLVAAVAALFLIGAGYIYAIWWGDGPSYRQVDVAIPQGATLRTAADRLAKAAVICCPGRFYRLARVLGSSDPIQAGEFTFPAQISPAEVLDVLQHGKPVTRLVTVPEGMPSILAHERLMAAPFLTGAVPVPAEGTLLPDSYGYERGDTRASIVARMQKAMDDYLVQAWAKRKPTSVAETPEEAVVLASIVEKETGKPSERRMVAAVYSNRLRIGMPLQADPTVIYPVTKGRPLGRRILRSELQAKNGYNTYASPGLPVGPIANPGRESIDAVLNPAESKALYFVADGTGGHVFAETLAEHNANVRKWYAIRRARGEM